MPLVALFFPRRQGHAYQSIVRRLQQPLSRNPHVIDKQTARIFAPGIKHLPGFCRRKGNGFLGTHGNAQNGSAVDGKTGRNICRHHRQAALVDLCDTVGQVTAYRSGKSRAEQAIHQKSRTLLQLLGKLFRRKRKHSTACGFILRFEMLHFRA
jgi:hypothetical protein